MAIRLKYNEKPADPQLTIRQKINGWNSESDVVWMTRDEWFGDSTHVTEDSDGVPAEIRAFIPGWREKARQIEENHDGYSFWPVKRASSTVFFDDKKYYIGTDILGDIGNQYTSDWIFEMISRTIEKDMYSIGATLVRYWGMID